MNSPYRQYVLDQIREIVLGYRPDAVFLDLYGQTLCYCNHCQKEFRSRTGLADGIGRIVGLGDKPVRTNPTQLIVVPNCDARLNKLRRFGDES